MKVLRLAAPWVVLLALHLGLRLLALDALPPFLDEVGHARWSVQIAEGFNLEKPWQYGKGLGIFVGALFVPPGPEAVLVARAVTAALSTLALLGVVLAACRLWDEATGFAAGLCYAVAPFAVFHERLFLTDPHGAAFSGLALWTAVASVRGGGRRHAVATGLLLACAVFSKALGVLFVALPLLAALCLAPRERAAWRRAGLSLAVFAATAGWPLVVFFRQTSTVRVAVEKDEGQLVPRIAENAALLGEWLWAYLTPALLLLTAAGLVRGLRERRGEAAFALLAAGLPLLALLAVSTLWFPRYVVPAVAPLCLLAGAGGTAAWRALGSGRLAAAVLVALAAALPLRFDAALLVDPRQAPLPAIDRQQFVDAWPSGYGVVETLAFLEREAAAHPTGIYVVTHSGSRRTTAWALQLAWERDARFGLDDVDLLAGNARWALEDWTSRKPTYLVISPLAPGRRRPDPAVWQDLGEPAIVTLKPDGSECDQVWKLPRR
ncbi:MAG: glycosyltransferase family 39 protein [Vicinamibacteria bacterium]|nr:glycosyltransferase family 39 protein [Vicinamibacteria bacterium]